MAHKPQFRCLKRPPVVASSVDRELCASRRGYGARWNKYTAPAVRERDNHLCRRCLEIGGIAMAVEALMRPGPDGKRRQMLVDHIIPAHVIPAEQFHDASNLQVLCPLHHAEKTADDLLKWGAAKR